MTHAELLAKCAVEFEKLAEGDVPPSAPVAGWRLYYFGAARECRNAVGLPEPDREVLSYLSNTPEHVWRWKGRQDIALVKRAGAP